MMKYVRLGLLCLLAAVVTLPLVMTLCASFMGEAELMEHIGAVLPGGSGRALTPTLPAAPTLRQYAALLLDTSVYLRMFWNSLLTVVPVVLGQAVVGTLAAWGFARYRFPARDGLFMGYIALMMMPFQVTLAPSYLALDLLNLIDTRWAIILPGIFSTFAVFLLRQFFQTVPYELVEAARIDSAGEARLFVWIGLPLGLPGVASLCVLSFLDNWNLIEQPMTFLKSQDKWPLSLYLPRIGESNVDVAFAASIVTLLPTLLLFFYCESYLVRGIQMAGLKE
ncbi:MAG: carbohydrate ABC transporter permease [Oscillospiraceae bacterium]|jgi:multiple sugar transport system permease protein|nr:carbohydrate ABC transporter permease [Oscillospiraceae bacterium]